MRILSVLFLILLFNPCSELLLAQGLLIKLSPAEFADKMKEHPNAPVLDVRTSGEFLNGHLEKAINYDWNGKDFVNQISTLDTGKPVFVYCLSGGRSSSATHKMLSYGFKNVYEMQGGFIRWRASNLPETVENKKWTKGMSTQQFDVLIQSNKPVLVSFYAEWCAPCKKMKPYLDELSKEMKDKIDVVYIDSDTHQTLCKELKIGAIPVLHFYKNNSLKWSHTGFIEKAEVVKHLD